MKITKLLNVQVIITGLSFDACLRMTKVRLELFTEPDMLLFIEKGVRGGVATISNRFSKVNNKYLPDAMHDVTQPTKYIQYYDANNLYGWSMSQPLPIGNFAFLNEEQISTFDVSTVLDDDQVGYILEVDLEYPANLHDLHNDYPLLPEKIVVHENMLSPYQKYLKNKLNGKQQGKLTKLIPNFYDKSKYVVHYRNLKFYLAHGIILKKINRILKFDQSTWLEPYIRFNTEKRKMAKSAEEKNNFKFLNNAIYGRMMMNLRKHQNIRLLTRAKSAKKMIARPNFDGFKIVNEDITMVKLRKLNIHWTKPTYVGFCILDLSKLHMYDFHYEKIIPTFGDRAKLLFTDTDSLCYEFQTDDVYNDMLSDIDVFDTSDYPVNHKCYSDANCKVIGKFKDECEGVAPLQFVGLRAKMYSLLMPHDKEKTTAKGIKTSYIKKHLRHETYLECLVGEEKNRAEFHCIRSVNHQLKTVKIVKDALNPYDDKRYILDNGRDTLAYGHYRINNTD